MSEKRVTRSGRTVSAPVDVYKEASSVEPTSKESSGLRSFIQQKFKGSKFSDSFLDEVGRALSVKLDQILSCMVIVSNHRAGLLPDTPPEYADEIKEVSASLEEFLLYKEDCAAYLTKIFPGPVEGLNPPVFNKTEYAPHAVEEENRMIITAQSVKRLTGKDLLPLLRGNLSPLIIPPEFASKLVQQIATNEMIAEYTTAHNP